MQKHTYKATFKDYKGNEIFITRTSTHNYKCAWLVQVRMYGWRIEQDGTRKDYDYIDTQCGFSSTLLPVSNHGRKDGDAAGKDWKKDPYEAHCRVLRAAVVPVEIIK